MNKLRISCEYIEHGWAELEFSNDIDSLLVVVSYVFDGLYGLLKAAYDLNIQVNETEISLFDEPCEYRVYLKKENNNLNLSIYYFEQISYIGDSKSKEDGILKFTAFTNLKRFTNQIIDLFYNFLNEYGEEKYKEKWHQPFPMDLYEKLKSERKY